MRTRIVPAYLVTILASIVLLAPNAGCPCIGPSLFPPAANAGADQNVSGGSTVTLTGIGIDLTRCPITFEWTQTDGVPVSLSNADSEVATFKAPSVLPPFTATLTFRFKVTDSGGASASDDVNVTVH